MHSRLRFFLPRYSLSRAALFALALLLWPLGARQSRAQDEDEAPAPSRPRAPAPGNSASAPTINLKLEDPAVRSVLESNPTTAKELVRAIDTLSILRRPELARPLVSRLLESKPDAKTLAALAEEFGSAVFIRLSGDAGLAPQGAELAQAVLAASYAERTDPALLAKLVTELSAADPLARKDAVAALGQARGAAVPPLLRALADPARVREHAAVREMLVRLGDESLGPLVAILESREPALQTQAAQALGRMRAMSAVPQLLVPALADAGNAELKSAASRALAAILGRLPNRQEAQQLLLHDARLALDKVRAERADPEPSAAVWRWDPQRSESVLDRLPPANAAANRAALFAEDAYLLAADAESRRLLVLAQLTAAKLAGGLDRPLATGEQTTGGKLRALGSELIQDALSQALSENRLTAATAAAEILGLIGQEEMLHPAGGALSPLAEAARSGDRRLRFAAIDAILKLNPTRSFAGAGSITPNLAFFAGTSGIRRALVVHPRTNRGRQLVSLLSALGYDADLVNTSRQFMEAAARSPDYELGLIPVVLSRPGADDLLARLRRDPRTADLSIGLSADAEMFAAAERVAKSLPLVLAIPPVATQAALQYQVARLVEQAGRDRVSFEERQSQAAAALDWLARLSDQTQMPFDLQATEPAVERALYVPALTRQAALVLANLPSAAGQRALADLAARGVLPIETRQAAAVAFSRSVRRSGVLLSSSQMLALYDQYNASAGQPQATQQVLAALLDAIEGKTRPADAPEGQVQPPPATPVPAATGTAAPNAAPPAATQ